MGEAFIVRKGGVVSDTTAAPTITIVTEAPDGVTFTLTNNDDNTAFITYEIDDDIAVIELAAAATSSNITVALAVGTYTLTAYATVVGEVASSATASVEILIPTFELLFDSTGTVTLPQTQIDITGLSIGKNDELRLVYTLVGASGTGIDVRLYANDNTTNSNYTSQTLVGNGTSISAFRESNPYLMIGADSTNKLGGFADIKVSDNDRLVYQSQHIRTIGSSSSSLRQYNINGVSSGFTLTNITKLSIVGSSANQIAAGSRIRLYKVNTGDA
jgi:hypothetical protein